MKKVFIVLAALGVCFGAYAQSSILEDWEHEIELREDNVFSPFAFMNFTYNHNLAAPEGYNKSGWGFEISFLHIGFNPWKNGRFSLGIFDFAMDYSYLRPGNNFVVNAEKNIVSNSLLVPENDKSRVSSLSFMFPLGYIQKFGYSNWSAAVFVSPGIGSDLYRNEYVEDNIRHFYNLRINRQGAYFRMDLKAMIWYDSVGLVVRYRFPKGFQGAGVLSAGISLRI